MSRGLINGRMASPSLHGYIPAGLFPECAFHLTKWKQGSSIWSFQSHPNMFRFRFIQNFENQSPRELQGRRIHMYDLISVEAKIPCIRNALSQRWLLAGIDFFVLLGRLLWPHRCSGKGHIYSKTDLLAESNTAQTSAFPDEVANS